MTTTPSTISADIRLDTPVSALSGIGDKRAAMLAALNIRTVQDLLLHLPREYQDRSVMHRIADLAVGDQVTLEAEIVSARSLKLRGGKTMALLEVRDDSGAIKASFFGRGFLAHTTLTKGVRCLFTGKVGEYKGLTLQNPEYEPIVDDGDGERLHTGRIVPIYPLTEGITQRMLRRWVFAALHQFEDLLPETLPSALRVRHAFPERNAALREIHFPTSLDMADAAQRRFAYEELLVMQLRILRRRAQFDVQAAGMAHCVDGPLLRSLRERLPFTLTEGQQRAVADILLDMAAPRPMFRLVQGDVGSGKTLVALHAVAIAADSDCQTAFMAPTEILAEQHFLTLREQLAPLGVEVGLLTGATASARGMRDAVARGKMQVLVGTHALFQEQTRFHRLGLVVIDEQHRFGVRQREELARKGVNPDLLHTTATPIPRTLAITLYGGMDISVMPDLPPGRMPVKTAIVPEAKKGDLYQYLRDQAQQGFQSYVVCPLVEESEFFAQLTPVIDHYLELSAGPLAGVRTALLHGRLDPREKEEIMRRFRSQEIDVLFATTVIEVGVDSPKATTMVVEDAWRFGLTQLHQLRGRVGRGTDQSYCFLLGTPTTPDGKKRLELLRTCGNGFEIAEADMAMRGPGDYAGVRQAGLADFRVADLLRDARLLDAARRDAAELLQKDPDLLLPEHVGLAGAVASLGDMFA